MLFWTEASQQIGMGHLMECLAIADSFQGWQIPFHFITNPYPPAEELLYSKNIPFNVLSINQVEEVCQRIKQDSMDCVIVNHRKIELSSLKRLKKEDFKVIVIDQLGNKTVVCDLLINYAIVSDWLEYTFIDKPPNCCFGADFAILRNEFMKLHQKEKRFSQGRKKVLVSMGGVDRSGATLRIMKALQLIGEPVEKEIILGKGFAHMGQFQQMCEKINDSHFTFAQGVNNLAEKMQKADIVISSGGNTTYEMACVGTPGIILWEDKHEDLQGRAFSEKGIVCHLGNGVATPLEVIAGSVEALLSNTKKLKQMSWRGKQLVDGKGKDRIFQVLMSLRCN